MWDGKQKSKRLNFDKSEKLKGEMLEFKICGREWTE
jgi:hypothetical protein